jgi:hypothetical protein
MKILNSSQKITVPEIKEMAGNMFGNFIKAVVDVELEIMAVDAELHADLEALLLENGSKQENLWGINLYPELSGTDFIEFDSMINIRPRQNNRSRNIEDPKVREEVFAIANKLVAK